MHMRQGSNDRSNSTVVKGDEAFSAEFEADPGNFYFVRWFFSRFTFCKISFFYFDAVCQINFLTHVARKFPHLIITPSKRNLGHWLVSKIPRCVFCRPETLFSWGKNVYMILLQIYSGNHVPNFVKIAQVLWEILWKTICQIAVWNLNGSSRTYYHWVGRKKTLKFIPPQPWPPNSPDLNSVDYSVLEYCDSRCTKHACITNLDLSTTPLPNGCRKLMRTRFSLAQSLIPSRCFISSRSVMSILNAFSSGILHTL